MARPMPLCAALVALAATAALGLAGPSVAAAPDDASLGGRSESQQAARSSAAAAADVSRRARRTAPAGRTPLAVTIDELSPSTIPERGPVRVSGTITNTDDVAWKSIAVYSFVSAEPMTTSEELAAAAATDPAAPVGDRIIQPRNYDTIEEIAPGAAETFSFRVARRLLEADTAGVYWFGVHALGVRGDSGAGSDGLADGRARTFLPMVPTGRAGRVEVAVVVPLRHQLNYAADGSVDDLATWTTTLGPGGRLRSLVEFGAASNDRAVSWVIDPALLDVVRRLADGNPPRSLAPNLAPGQADGEDGADPDATGSPSAKPADEPPASASPDQGQGDPPTKELTAEEQSAATAARVWLGRLRTAIRPEDQVFALPYGDVDVSAAARHDPGVYQRARNRSGGALDELGLLTAPVVASPAGYLSGAALRTVEPETTVLVTDEMFGTRPPVVATAAGHRLVVTSSGAMAGGPGPDDPRAAVATRQRLLAEAAVRFLTPRRPPVVALLPPDWIPGSGSTFFAGLDVPWLDLASVQRAAAAVRARPIRVGKLRYPTWQARAELDAANFASAESLVSAGQSLQNLLTLNNIVGGTVTDQALGSTSYSSRVRPNASRATTDQSREWIEERLAKVDVQAPVAVTLSSSSGRFATTIRNDLDQPVTVSLEARSDDRLHLETQPRIEVPANSHATAVLRARTNENGVHRVTLVVTDKSGTPLGGSTALTIRSAQISNVIWLFLGLGAVLLFGAIVLRLVRRERWWTRAATIRAADGGMPSDDATDESADRGGDPGSTPENSGSDDATPAPTGARTR